MGTWRAYRVFVVSMQSRCVLGVCGWCWWWCWWRWVFVFSVVCVGEVPAGVLLFVCFTSLVYTHSVSPTHTCAWMHAYSTTFTPYYTPYNTQQHTLTQDQQQGLITYDTDTSDSNTNTTGTLVRSRAPLLALPSAPQMSVEQVCV